MGMVHHDRDDGPLFCFRKAESKDSFLWGSGILREWKAFSYEESMRALEEMRRFQGWKIGFLNYDFGLLHEEVKSRHGGGATPLLYFMAPKKVGVSHGVPRVGGVRSGIDFFAASVPKPQISRDDYVSAVEKIHRLLKAGETYQVNFSYPFSGTFEGSLWAFFQRLYDINPSPHACFLNFGGLAVACPALAVVSNSPERLLCGRRADDGGMWLETKPIKGTVGGEYKVWSMKYGEQGALNRMRKILGTEKHAAELDMIVDLARNDLGKVSEYGSVHVVDHRKVEIYSHVAHTVSTVRGKLREGLDWVDALMAVFPGGSVTGAPKKRTMEIIDKLEHCGRGIYTGSAGWISPEGEFDFNILIRTVAFVRDGEGRGRYVFNSGGGIVADSVAGSEYEETLHKAAAIIAALA